MSTTSGQTDTSSRQTNVQVDKQVVRIVVRVPSTMSIRVVKGVLRVTETEI